MYSDGVSRSLTADYVVFGIPPAAGASTARASDESYFNHKEDKTMAYKRTEIPELEKAMAGGRKKFVRYEEGARLYSMGLHSFEALAKEAGAVYHIKRVALVNTDRVDEYLENFRDEVQ